LFDSAHQRVGVLARIDRHRNLKEMKA